MRIILRPESRLVYPANSESAKSPQISGRECKRNRPTFNGVARILEQGGPRKPIHKFADWKMYDVLTAPPPPHSRHG